MLNDLNAAMVGHLLLAALLGGLVGLERQLRHKPAGLRTNMLICFGSALFTMISYEMAGNVGGDHTRIAAQIIPGIGFIGAGVVLRERGTIVGITSAATIFVMASIGMAVGAGMVWTATFATMFCLVALILLGKLEDRTGLVSRILTFRLEAQAARQFVERAHQIVQDGGISAHRWQTRSTGDDTSVEFDADVTLAQERELLSKLSALNVHCEVRPQRQ
jgi:putative Mg2+ transporter-C (MgtC) family protein